jgi:hypothetical protein
VIFVDWCLGVNDVPSALKKAGVKRVEVLKDHYDSETDDQTWLEEVGAKAGSFSPRTASSRRTTSRFVPLAPSR